MEPDTQTSKRNLSHKSKASIMIPDFKLYSAAVLTKTTWYWEKKGKKMHESMEQNKGCTKTPGTFSYLIFAKVAKNIHLKKDSPCNK